MGHIAGANSGNLDLKKRINELEAEVEELNSNKVITPSVDTRYELQNGGYINIGNRVLVEAVVKSLVDRDNSPSVFNIEPIKIDSALNCIDITNGITNSITSSAPCGVASNGTVYIKAVEKDHIYAITGMVSR